LDEIQNRLDSGENPKNIKMDLALWVVEFFHSKEEAQKAKENWEKQFSQKAIPDNLQEFEFESGVKILEVLKETELTSSNKEGKRKIDEGAVQIIDGEKVTDHYFSFDQGEYVLKLGKKMVKLIIR